VNVGGTTNVFEAVRRSDRVGKVVYASSIAVYNAGESGPHPALDRHPQTVYGVFKRANEGTAHVYWADHALPSIGLRPHTVYGPGRDQGITSTPTAAMLAAASGRPYRISFGGSAQMQHADDAAGAFIAAALADAEGA
jgi:nucleoside-diphosphate-sugar epimerase